MLFCVIIFHLDMYSLEKISQRSMLQFFEFDDHGILFIIAVGLKTWLNLNSGVGCNNIKMLIFDMWPEALGKTVFVRKCVKY